MHVGPIRDRCCFVFPFSLLRRGGDTQVSGQSFRCIWNFWCATRRHFCTLIWLVRDKVNCEIPSVAHRGRVTAVSTGD